MSTSEKTNEYTIKVQHNLKNCHKCSLAMLDAGQFYKTLNRPE